MIEFKALSGQRHQIYRSRRYEDVYKLLKEKAVLSNVVDLFLICAAIGIIKNKKEAFVRGVNMNTYNASSIQHAQIYSMLIIIDSDQYNYLENEEALTNGIKDLEQYAEGGMSIILDEWMPEDSFTNDNGITTFKRRNMDFTMLFSSKILEAYLQIKT
jgi:hypothetical protein